MIWTPDKSIELPQHSRLARRFGLRWPPRWGKGTTWVKNCNCCSGSSSPAPQCCGFSVGQVLNYSISSTCAAINGSTGSATATSNANGLNWFTNFTAGGISWHIALTCFESGVNKGKWGTQLTSNAGTGPCVGCDPINPNTIATLVSCSPFNLNGTSSGIFCNALCTCVNADTTTITWTL